MTPLASSFSLHFFQDSGLRLISLPIARVGASMNVRKCCPPQEDVLRGISLLRGQLESAFGWQPSGDLSTAQPGTLSPDEVEVAQAALGALSVMVQRGNHSALMSEAMFPNPGSHPQSQTQARPLWRVVAAAMGCGSERVSLEAARLVALVFESIQADDQETLSASGLLIEPLLVLMTEKVGGEGEDGADSPLGEISDVTDARRTPQSWAYRALGHLVAANPPTPVFQDAHVIALVDFVTNEPSLPHPILLLYAICDIPERRRHVRCAAYVVAVGFHIGPIVFERLCC